MLIGTRLGPYEIVAPLGAGGMGEVFKARDTRLGRVVAIKVLPAGLAADPDRRRRFEQEARAVAALSHPHICVLHDTGSQDGIDFLVMEYLEGEALSERLQRTPIPLSEALEIGAQVADALGAAHRRGIVHRDLKPANIMLTPTGGARHGSPHVKLLDFGLAKLRPEAATDGAGLSELTTQAPLTGDHQLLGTVPYMAPEQLEGKPVDARSDVFALGCVLYEMLTGRRAFEGASSATVIAAILTSEPPPVSTLQPVTPPLLDRLVQTCLAKRPDDRWDSAHDVAGQLRAISDASGTPRDAATGVRAAPTSWRNSRRVLLASAAALILVAAVGAALFYGSSGRRPPIAGARPSVVALPCAVPAAPEDAYLADAVPRSLTDALARLEGLDVIEPPASLEVEKVRNDPERLAKLYPASYFVKSSLTASPDGALLIVQLVEPATRKVAMSRPYPWGRGEYRKLVQAAADEIGTYLAPHKSPPVRAATAASPADAELDRGRFLHTRYRNNGDRADFDAALEAYTRALSLSPRAAVPLGRIADLYAAKLQTDGYSPETYAAVQKWAADALLVDSRCGDAWVARSAAELFSPQADTARGVEFAVKGVTFTPRDAYAHRILGMWGLGTTALFVAANRKAAELDPFLLGPTANAAVGLTDLGRAREALQLLDRALVVDPDYGWGRAARGYALTKLGRLSEAESALRDSEAACAKQHAHAVLWRYVRFALAVAQTDASTSKALAQQIIAQVSDPKADANLVSDAPYFAGPPLVRMGRPDDAMRILVRSVDAGVAPFSDWLLADPDIRRLRGDPRFPGVLAESRKTAAVFAAILGQARARGELPDYLHAPLDDLVKLLKESDGGT